MPDYGTRTLSDLLAETSQTVASFGEATIWEVFQASLDAHERQMAEMVGEFCMFTQEKLLGSGGVQQGDFQELAEAQTPRPQKIVAGQNLGLPLRSYGFGQQWTERTLTRSTPNEMARQFLAVLDADRRNIINQFNRAVYPTTNYNSVDILMAQQATLPVKRLANADGFAIPPGPNGEVFDGFTHTHYLARAGGAWAAADMDRQITTTQEHYAGIVRVGLNAAQEAPIRAFAGFTPIVDSRVIQASTSTYATGALDVSNPGNRLIGIYNGAEIWIKPWVISGYVVSWNLGAPKTCGFRTEAPIAPGAGGPDGIGAGALRPLYTQRGFPLMNRGWGRDFGIGVTGRVSMAIMYVNGSVYTEPTLIAAAA